MTASVLALLGLGAWYASERNNNPADIFWEPSLAKSCLTISDGLNTYQPSEVESADFCAPGGAFIQSVAMRNDAEWGFSQPWQVKGKISPMRDRLAFARKTAKPTASELTIRTAHGVYLMVIAAEPASSEQPL